MAEHYFHVRSISMPSTSHPSILRIKEKIHNLQTCEVPEMSCPSTSTSSITVLCKKLRCLRGLYDDIQDLLHLPRIQLCAENSNQRKWLEHELDGSLAILDLCGAMKDAVIALKEHVQDLQLASRRKSTKTCTKKELQVLRKEIQNVMKKCNKKLKKLYGDSDSSNFEVLEELHKAREFTIAVLLSVSSSMSMTKIKSNKWPFASKVMLNKRIACKNENVVETSIDVLASNNTTAQDNFETTKTSLSDLENGLEILYRSLIQHRVSILNIFSL